MADKIIQLTSCGNAAEADHLRGLLADQGIDSFVDGVHSHSALSYVGPALGGVKLFVRAQDATKAAEVIADALEVDDQAADWYCGPCQEVVDAEFDLCWSCGKPRSEVGQPIPTEGADKTLADWSDYQPAETEEQPVRDEANPYASPRAAGEVSETPDVIHEEAEAMLKRAWYASVLGIGWLPIVLNIYSMYLLFRASSLTDTFTPAGQRRFYGAFAFNLGVTAVWGTALYLIIRR